MSLFGDAPYSCFEKDFQGTPLILRCNNNTMINKYHNTINNLLKKNYNKLKWALQGTDYLEWQLRSVFI